MEILAGNESQKEMKQAHDPLDGPMNQARPFSQNSELAVREPQTMDIATTRAAQEVQAAMVIAKKMPRDEMKSFHRIMKACERITLAEDATYAFPRGGTTVSGPSIRLAEVLAQNWGNIDSGVIELEQKDGESVVMVYAWDLETNTKSTKIFTVKHIRSKRSGNVALDDPRDIYEMTANQGARRLRACILSIMPGDIVDAAVKQCEDTLAKGASAQGPIEDRLRVMVIEFGKFGVSQEMIEKRLGHKVTTTTEAELVGLKKVFRSIRDNMSAVEDFFPKVATGAQEAKKPEAGTQTGAPAPTEATKAPAIPFDATKPSTEIYRFLKEHNPDGATEAQVVVWAKTQKLAGAKIEQLAQMADAKLLNILTNWPTILPEVTVGPMKG